MRNSSSLVFCLDFASLYQCAIHPLKKVSQKKAVNFLLEGISKTLDFPPIPDSSCSQYCTGKRTIPEAGKNDFLSISMEEFKTRMAAIGIKDFALLASILKYFISIAYIPRDEKEKLFSMGESLEPDEFTKEVFDLAISNPAKGQAFSREELSLLSNLKNNCKETDYSAKRSLQSYTSSNSFLSKEETDWLRQYIPLHININLQALDASVTIQHQTLRMPEDFATLIRLIGPALNEEHPLAAFSYEDFLEYMEVHPSTGKLSKGRLEYWILSGPVQNVVEAITRLNFHDASDIVHLTKGEFNLDEIADIENAIKKASNPQIRFLHTLCYESSLKGINVTLIVHLIDSEVKKENLHLEDGNTTNNGTDISSGIIEYPIRLENT